MNTRLLLSVVAVLLAALGLLLCFAPDELMHHHGWPADPVLSLVLQCMGGLALGLALLDWMARGMLLGGIYGRPIVVGNLLAFTIAALAVVKAQLHGELPAAGWMVVVPCLVFAVLFGRLLFVPPKP